MLIAGATGCRVKAEQGNQQKVVSAKLNVLLNFNLIYILFHFSNLILLN